MRSRGHALGARDLGGRDEHPPVAVHGHDGARPDEPQPLGDLARVRVPGDVDRRLRLADDARAAAHEVVAHPVDRPLVARDRARREQHEVALRELQVRVLAERQAVERGEGLALASRRQAEQPLGRRLPQIRGGEPRAQREPQPPEALGDLGDRPHAAPEHRDAAAARESPASMPCESRATWLENVVRMMRPRAARTAARRPSPGGPLGEGAARPLGVGRVDEREVDARSDRGRDPLAVGRLAVGRIVVELEVAGVEDARAAGLDQDGRRVGHGVRDAEERHAEGTGRDRLAAAGLDETGRAAAPASSSRRRAIASVNGRP